MTEETKQEDWTLDLDVPQNPIISGQFLRKKDLLDNPMSFKIVNIERKSKYKFDLGLENENGPVILEINNQAFNQLLKLYGPTIKEWFNKEVEITGSAKEYNISSEPEPVMGVELTFEKV